MSTQFGLPAELADLANEYELRGELGRGGSAIVYRGRDRVLDRDVAIKVVHPRPTSPDDDPVARLAREARTVAQLHHAGIVSVFAVRRLNAGGIALIMQLVPGRTLKATILRDGPFSPDRAEYILRDVAAALAYAHGRQVVHRDVKPENIFVDDDTGRALLADFGIARSAETDSLTLTGTAIGTPFYMSPEQVEGLPVDGRSDVYSLGLVAWEMLTGLRPWDGESLYHVIYKQKHDDLPPIEAFRRDVPRRLQYIVERMLQKRPAARWAGADGLLAQLDRTILPSDYAKWHAALPGRVARHREAAEAQQRAKESSTATSAASAATMQFGATTGAAPDPTLGDTAIGLVPLTPRLVAADADTAEPAAPAADPVLSYDTAVPVWDETPAPPPRIAPVPSRPRTMWRRIGRGSVVIAGVAVGAFAFMRDGSQLAGVDDASAGAAVASLRGSRVPRVRVPERDEVRAHATGTPASHTELAHAGNPNQNPDLLGVGEGHQCRITPAKSVECWGANDRGQLGEGSRARTNGRPRPVVGVMTYTGLGAGAAHTCGVTEPGDVYCWGANDRGQLGDGTALARAAPVRVGGPGTYVAVRGGARHTCALDAGGDVRCWGENADGQLGIGTRVSKPMPTLARLPEGTRAVAVAVGARHSCAVLGDQRVVCWGSNASGQLGVAGDSVRDAPAVVSGVRALSITAGGAHTCAVLVTAGVRCWGLDDAGQLGDGPVDDRAPGRLVTLPNGEAISVVAAGTSHTCVLTVGGHTWCWGRTGSQDYRAPVRLGAGPYTALAAGGDRTCTVALGRAAECWGGPPTLLVAAGRPAAPHRRLGRHGAGTSAVVSRQR